MKKHQAIERICPICGKRFITAPYHIYKRQVNGKDTFLCGWDCCVFVDKEKEKKKGTKS